MADNNSSGGQNLSPPAYNGLCKQGCGFYGNSQFEGMCSKCYKDFMARQQSKDEAAMREGQVQQVQRSLNTIAESLLPAGGSAADVVAAAATAANPLTSGALPTCSSASSSPPPVPVLGDCEPVAMDTDMSASAEELLDCSGGAAADSSLSGGDPVVDCSSNPTSCSTSASISVCPDPPAADKKPPKRKNRCAKCDKRVGLMGFECRCGSMFCSMHRYSDSHECRFDFQTHGQAQIRAANPQIQAAKLEKI